MFGKKCTHCNSKLKKDFEFCPSCGVRSKNSSGDYGMLGRNDSPEEIMSENIFPGFSGQILNKMIKNLMGMVEKELSTPQKAQDPSSNFQLYINGKPVGASKKTQEPKSIQIKDQPQELPLPSQEIISASKDLPRTEAKYTLKRMGTKIVYEVNLPGIDSMENILINKLEDSIEVRAFAKKKVLTANLQVNIPLLNYQFQNQKLVLEFQGN